MSKKDTNKNKQKFSFKRLMIRATELVACALLIWMMVMLNWAVRRSDELAYTIYYRVSSAPGNFVHKIYATPILFFRHRDRWFRPEMVGFDTSLYDENNNARVALNSMSFKFYVHRGRFLKAYRAVVKKKGPGDKEFRTVAEYKNLTASRPYFNPAVIYSDTGLAPDTVYNYLFQACNILKCSEPVPIQIRTEKNPPRPPIDLQAFVVSPIQINLGWRSGDPRTKEFMVEKFSSAQWEICSSSSCPERPVHVAAVADPVGFSSCPLQPGTQYTFLVKASDGKYESEKNPAIVAATLPLNEIGENFLAHDVAAPQHSQPSPDGKGWISVFSDNPANPNHPEDENEQNSEIFFQSFNLNFTKAAKLKRVTFQSVLLGKPENGVEWRGVRAGMAGFKDGFAKMRDAI